VGNGFAQTPYLRTFSSSWRGRRPPSCPVPSEVPAFSYQLGRPVLRCASPRRGPSSRSAYHRHPRLAWGTQVLPPASCQWHRCAFAAGAGRARRVHRGRVISPCHRFGSGAPSLVGSTSAVVVTMVPVLTRALRPSRNRRRSPALEPSLMRISGDSATALLFSSLVQKGLRSGQLTEGKAGGRAWAARGGRFCLSNTAKLASTVRELPKKCRWGRNITSGL